MVAPSCHADGVPVRNRDAHELRAVAPLVAVGESPQLVAAVTLVTHGGKTVAVTSGEMLRAVHGQPLAIAIDPDGARTVGVASVGLGRYVGLALLELDGPIPDDAEVQPLTIDHVSATANTRGAPAAICTIARDGAGYARTLIPVHVDDDDGGGMSDTVTRLASPVEAAHAALDVEGAPVFAWFPPDPVLGRTSEVLLVALAYPYRAQIAKPRELAPIAELVDLEDLGRALISRAAPPVEQEPDLPQIAGEITHDD